MNVVEVLTEAQLAEALPGHKYDNPAYPRDHEGCLLTARAILRNLKRQQDAGEPLDIDQLQQDGAQA